MEDRLVKLEEALAEVQRENRALRTELQELRGKLPDDESAMADARAIGSSTLQPGSSGARWSILFLLLSLVLVPVLAITVGHLGAFWGTTLGAVNGIILYFAGPTAYHLLIEGLVRAIPGIVLGQSARLALDRVRNRRTRKP